MSHSEARERMVRNHVAARGVRDRAVLDALREVPRERFVDPGMEEFAYEDSPLPIGEGQTISQPYIVALMAQAAEIGVDDAVLEVGTGSGYAAAVFGRMAARVDTVERHPALARQAEARLEALDYENVHVHVGDGTRGLPARAPFDAIVVAAGAPQVPDALRQQLAIGGRLVLPVGEDEHGQRLRKITRVAAEDFEEDDLGGVRFVPLIGEQGWQEDGRRAASRHVPGQARGRSVPELIAEAAIPLPDPGDNDFAEAFDRFAGARVVLLGECSHGTSEFYAARAAITRRLIEVHGYSFVAVEADWPDAFAINRHVRGLPPPAGSPPVFERFPTWMWRNAEVARFVATLAAHNAGRDAGDRAGFYGLDIYNMYGSIAAVLAYLDETDPEAAAVARERYGCLTPWQHDPATYGRAVLSRGYAGCEREVVAQCRELLERQLQLHDGDGGDERLLDATQNARLVASAEQYYRMMYYGGAASWNLRDRHMFETLELLLEAKGPDSRAVVWAHNSHIGDARETDMGGVRGELNLGQLCRERFAGDAVLVGFGTHAGTVAAADDWGGAMAVKKVRPSHRDSAERLCHDAGVPRFLLDLREASDGPAREALLPPRLQRFIGVIYRPETELASHYAGASLARQYDAYAWFETTRAVTPLAAGAGAAAGEPDTFPFGV